MARLHLVSSSVELFFLAASTIFLILIILSGSSHNPSFPINRFYWLKADTSNITNAYTTSKWTYWGVCESVGNKVRNCNDVGPAIPIDPVYNFDTETGVDKYFIDNDDTFYYLSRVGWCTLLISLVFTVISLLLSVFSVCSYHVQKLTALFVFIANIMQFAAAALYTATLAMAKKHLPSGKIGPIMMGFLWAATVSNFVVLITTFGACVKESYSRAKERHALHHPQEEQQVVYDETKKSDSSGIFSHHRQSQVPTQASGIPEAPQQFEDPYATTNINDNVNPEPSAHKSGGINFFNIKRNRKTDEESDI